MRLVKVRHTTGWAGHLQKTTPVFGTGDWSSLAGRLPSTQTNVRVTLLQRDHCDEDSQAAIIRRLDDEPVSRVHVLAMVISAVGFTFDLSETAVGTALSGVFSAPPHAVPPDRLAWMLSSIYLGAILGPPLFGALADRYGRRIALVASLLTLALTSLAGACTPDIAALSVARGLSGISLGAYPPLMITYLTDLLPARCRGTMIMVTVTIGYLGPPATVFLMRWLTPLEPLGFEAWRWVLAVGGVGAAVGGLLFICLPESPRWVLAARRMESRLTTIERPQLHYRVQFLLVAVLSFLSPWATVAFPLLTGTILVARGFTLSDTLLYVGVATFGPFIGAVLAAAVADRIERRTALVVCAAGMMATCVGFWLSTLPIWLMLASIGFNLFVALYLPAISLYTAELFPTRIRASVTARAWSINRIAAWLGPMILLPLLQAEGSGAIFGIITGALVVSVLLILLFGPPGEAGRPVG